MIVLYNFTDFKQFFPNFAVFKLLLNKTIHCGNINIFYSFLYPLEY